MHIVFVHVHSMLDFIPLLHLPSVGVLGSLNLDDLSPHGHLHSCKFTTLSEKEPNKGSLTGTNALQFDVFKLVIYCMIALYY